MVTCKWCTLDHCVNQQDRSLHHQSLQLSLPLAMNWWTSLLQVVVITNSFITILIQATQGQHHVSITTISTESTHQLNGSWATRNQHPWIQRPLYNSDSHQRVGKHNVLQCVYYDRGHHLDCDNGKEASCTCWVSGWFCCSEKTSSDVLLGE